MAEAAEARWKASVSAGRRAVADMETARATAARALEAMQESAADLQTLCDTCVEFLAGVDAYFAEREAREKQAIAAEIKFFAPRYAKKAAVRGIR